MTQFKDLLKQPVPRENEDQQYIFRNSVYEFLRGISNISNKSIINNADFSTLGPSGMTPTTEADGDNAQFVDQFFVVGSAVATYTLTPTNYPNNSPIVSASKYYVNANISGYAGSGLYFYQRQLNTARLYQANYLTITVRAKNNGTNVPKLRAAINTYYNPSSNLQQGAALFLQPGNNALSSTLTLQSLAGQSVGAGAYTEFRLLFDDLGPTQAANIDFYSIKAEFGTMSTPLY